MSRRAGTLAVLAALLLLGGATALGIAPWARRAPVEGSPPPTVDPSPPAEAVALRGRPEPASADADVPDPVDLDAVDRDLDVHGVVVDGDSNPIADAAVLAVRRPWRG